MSHFEISMIVGLVILILAIPFVATIRHPTQKPLAAYLIFLSVFLLSAMILFSLLAWLVSTLGMGPALADLGPAVLFLALVFVPAVLVASWQARQPPWRREPP